MEFTVKLVVACAIVAVAYASPMPQEGVEAAVAPAQPNRPLINAITSAFQSINNAFSTAGSLAQNAFGTVANTGLTAAQTAADNANYFINTAADTFQSGLNTVNQNINLATAAWRPSQAPPNVEPVISNDLPEVFIPEAIAA